MPPEQETLPTRVREPPGAIETNPVDESAADGAIEMVAAPDGVRMIALEAVTVPEIEMEPPAK